MQLMAYNHASSFLFVVSCSKEKQTMSNGLQIEDIKIGEVIMQVHPTAVVNYTGTLEDEQNSIHP